MSDSTTAADLLRSAPVFPQAMPSFDPAQAPASPLPLFLEWLESAVRSGIHAPHAVNLATVGEDGAPDARIVILKDVTGAGWAVASSTDSPKGRQLAANPSAALTFFWPELGRQVRVRGPVAVAGPEENDRDFQRRHPSARALVLAGRQSAVVEDPNDIDSAVRARLAQLEAEPGLGSASSWAVFTVEPAAVEFWQADPERRHIRLRYTRTGGSWRTDRLWP
ncbi:pyridoxine/pyridoxamine 5'-phosphate oxidase [Arthrobacter sp. TMN-37]